MEWKDGIWEQIGSGFTRTDLEKLIGLPYNSLSNALKKDRFYSKKNIIKIERWLLSDKPDPITLKNVESKVRVSKNKPKEVPVEEKTKKNVTVFDGDKKIVIHKENENEIQSIENKMKAYLAEMENLADTALGRQRSRFLTIQVNSLAQRLKELKKQD